MDTALTEKPVVADLLTVATATANDIPLVMALARRIWPVAYAGILTPQQIENMMQKIYCPENLQDEMAKGHRFWLAYHGNNAIAYASAYRENESIIWLKKIYVESAMQGRGVGRMLIETVIASFMPAEELRLLVNPDNVPAHRYYFKAGFRKIGEVPVRMGDWNFTDHLFSKSIRKD